MKNIDLFLIITLIISFISIFLVKFLFVNIEEKWDFGYETGEIVYNLSLAFIASFIFYLIVVFIPEKRKHKIIYQQASKITFSIFLNGSTLLREPNEKFDIEENIEPEEFWNKCLRTGPNLPQDYYSSPTTNRIITYREGISEKLKNIRKEAQNLFVYINFLDIEHIKLINDILSCDLMKMESYFTDPQYTENVSSFEFISQPLHEFYEKIRLLKKYTNI